MGQMSSIDIAILSKVNDLAARFKLKASDAGALLSYDEKERPVLDFPSEHPPGEKQDRFKQMMALLGCNGGPLITEDTCKMEEVLDTALKKAPSVARAL